MCMLARVCLRAKVELDTFLSSKDVNELAERFETLAVPRSWVGVFWVETLYNRECSGVGGCIPACCLRGTGFAYVGRFF